MKAAKCRLCGHEHWGLEHVFAAPSSGRRGKAAVTNAVTNGRELSAGAVRAAKWREAHLEENRAKQRERMKAYRAKRRGPARAGFSDEPEAA